jgi:hypothetical protein
MANPTTYFGWVMPNSADLVTDLPADFNVFGQGVDTSMQYLLGGTTGQILSKTSGTNMAFTWINNDQGDITAVTAGTGISGGGTSGAVTITNSMATEITAKGDLIAGTGSATFDNLPVGTNGQTLVADSTASTGLKWATPSGGGKVLQVVNATNGSVVSSATNTWVTTNLTASITPSSATSTILVLVSQNGVGKDASSAQSSVGVRLKRDATVLSTFAIDTAYTNTTLKIIGWSSVLSYKDSPATTSAITYSTEFRSSNNTATVYVQDSAVSSITLMEIGA